MRDNGLVLAVERNLAEVEVSCLEGCDDCVARSLCIGRKQTKGRLSVRNSLGAQPGDQVTIEIPEEHYSKALALLFAGLLIAMLAGMGGGYLLALLLPFSSLSTSIFGFVIGLLIGVFFLSRLFRKKNEQKLYPEIIDILNKGDHYVQA
jgi:positive regulator of sigma E activity